MTNPIHVEFWHLVGLLLAFIGVLAGFGKILLDKMEKQLDQSTVSLNNRLDSGLKSLNERVNTLDNKYDKRIDDVERDLRDTQFSLPNLYQRREDAIRFETVLNAKLDSIGGRMERLVEQRN
ncbi:MAG: hypothetical protein Q7K57_12750 [Burkholderiaceae bacterium]|nr:hypothetical protein [Burkholderiaceae bacterium]